jgi:deoxyribodipyrimidine photo-lyase
MVQIVWFKRDLRVADHRPLVEAARRGSVLPLYVAEPEYWAEPDSSGRHWAFIAEALEELQRELALLGQPLLIRRGQVTDVLQSLSSDWSIAGLWSHEETGNAWTFKRDKAVANWCRSNGIPWIEIPQNGVMRLLQTRNGWAKAWDARMSEAPVAPPHITPVDTGGEPVPSAGDLGIKADLCPERQKGGRHAGLERLDSFLSERGVS